MSKTSRYTVLWSFLAMIMLTSCISRYRMDLFMTTNDNMKKANLEGTEFVRGAVIRDPMAEEKLQQGNGNCIILRLGARGDRVETDMTETLFLGYDEYVRCLVYIEIPTVPQTTTYDLKDNSFIYVLGQYDQSLQQTIYHAGEGILQVDSIIDKKMFVNLDGDYSNADGTPIKLVGKIRVKIAD